MENLFTAIVAPMIISVVSLSIEYYYFVPNSQNSNNEKEKVRLLLFGGVFIILGIAFIYGLSQIWSFFSLVVVYVFIFGAIVFLWLYIHNIFYHATFLRVKYFQQYFSEDYDGAIKTLKDIAQARPNDLSPLLQQANIFLEKTKNYDSAIVTLNKILAKTGDRYDTLNDLREAYWGLVSQKPDDRMILGNLINVIERMLSIDPLNSDLVCEFASIYFYCRDFQTGMKKINGLLDELMKSAKEAYGFQNSEKAKEVFAKVINDQNKIIEILSYYMTLPTHEKQ